MPAAEDAGRTATPAGCGLVRPRTAGTTHPAPGREPEPVRVHLMLAWDGRLLFARHPESGLWGFPCGELRAGESAVDGACRIGVEQILVEVARSAVCLIHVHRGAGTPTAGAGLFVRAGRFRGIPLVADPRQVDQLAWATPATVPEPCAPGVADAAAASGGPYVADHAGHVPGSPTPVWHRYRLGRLAPGTLVPGTLVPGTAGQR